jgi:iron(III) transport system substrate-binding protein
VYAKPILDALEKQTGLDIQPLFDVESAKAAGLANKIRAEHRRPRADVFWASTVLQTEMLAEEGGLAPYISPSAADVPVGLKDPKGYWTGMGVRARVMVATKEGVSQPLTFIPPNLAGTFAISNPQFGTASDWAAAYATRWGKDKALAYFQKLKGAGARVLPGNSDVAVAVADGNLEYGITDSDDFLAQRREKKPIFLVKTTKDNVLVPGCASMVAGAPHPENARKLLDALLSAQTEAKLVAGMPGVFSVRHMQEKQGWQSGGVDFSFVMGTEDDYAKWRPAWKEIRAPLADLLTP